MHSTAPFAFDWQPRTRLIFGPDTLERVGDIARDLEGKRALLVTDAGIVKAGHAGRAVGFIAAAGLQVEVYDAVRENPSTADVTECVTVARKANVDILIGLGGGSSMDTAKGCNFILTNGGEMKDYWGVGKATKPMLPLIAIPTTSGTGSECQSAALIADEVTHQKMACLDPKAAARVAILDPVLTLSQPARVTACTGVDAIVHALEAAVTKKRNAISAIYAREAFRLCFLSLPRVLERPDDLEARARMLLGAAFAGTAIENSMLGAAHSCANPLTARHNVVHGQAVGLMIRGVMRFNAALPEVEQVYRDLAADVGIGSVEELIFAFDAILEWAGLRGKLSEFGLSRDGIPLLAQEAAKQWTAQFNPRTIVSEDFARLFEEVL
ncbi:MAG TPA: iron-containing alcohol dehydrogenase [Chthoniobacteraceae bacterium]|nr:iron-containing alcohol dehydrogenase [Chthoniobacteraceae bacterium]